MSQFLSLDQEVNLQWVWRTLKIYFHSHSLPFTNICSALLVKVVLGIKGWRGPGLESSTSVEENIQGCTQHLRSSQGHGAHRLSFPISSFANSIFVLIMTWQYNFGGLYWWRAQTSIPTLWNLQSLKIEQGLLTLHWIWIHTMSLL